MEKLSALWRRLVFHLRRDRFDRELDEEVQFHLEMKARELEDEGMSPDEARLAARRQFGNVTAVAERSASVWSLGWLESTARDVRFAARSMRKAPVFTVAAVLTLAIGIGLNTAAFSAVRAVLLRPLPFPDADRLVNVISENGAKASDSFSVSPADFKDFRASARSFEGIAAYSGGPLTIDDGDSVETIGATRVSDDFFSVLGARPALGRDFSPEEFAAGSPSVLLSHRFWQRRFGGDPSVVGSTILTTDGPYQIVGVMPPDFKLPSAADLWLPLGQNGGEMQLRGSRYMPCIARLKPGVTIADATADLGSIAAGLAERYPKSNTNWSVRVQPLHETFVGKTRPPLLILFAATALVLLIACANVAHLLLARATARHSEMMIRSAIGASRGRVVRQLVTENLVLALSGGALGVVFAVLGLDAVVWLMPKDRRIPALGDAGLDLWVLAFAFVASVAVAVVFGTLVGLRASRVDVRDVTRVGARAATAGRGLNRLRGGLVALEVALTIVLAVSAGLLVKSLLLLERADLGFDPDNLLVIRAGTTGVDFTEFEKRAGVFDRYAAEVAAVPGVESVAMTSSVPLGITYHFPFRVDGAADEGEAPVAAYSAVSPSYFSTARIPVLGGRAFEATDRTGSPQVAIINDTMRRRYFPGGDAIGRRISVDYMGSHPTVEVVGVVGDTTQLELDKAPTPQIYVPTAQSPWFDTAFFIRTSLAPATVIPDVQRAIRSVDRKQAAAGATTMSEMASEATGQSRFYSTLLGLFAAVAVLLAAVGIFGVMSYSVAQRTREIGIRMALGADRGRVIGGVISHTLKLVAVGTIGGVAAAFGLTRLLEALLYGVSASDPTVFTAIPIMFVVVALVAAIWPARRAANVDPVEALRRE